MELVRWYLGLTCPQLAGGRGPVGTRSRLPLRYCPGLEGDCMPLRRGCLATRSAALPWVVALTCVLTVWLVAPAGAAGPRKPLAGEATARTLTKCTFAALEKAVAAAREI